MTKTPMNPRELAEWLVSLDDPDPSSAGNTERRTVTLSQIIERAREVLELEVK